MSDLTAEGAEKREPLRQSYSHEEALVMARDWMRKTYGSARDLSGEEQDRYFARLGLLVDFLHVLHPMAGPMIPDPQPYEVSR